LELVLELLLTDAQHSVLLVLEIRRGVKHPITILGV
jgi:hypothetical protein